MPDGLVEPGSISSGTPGPAVRPGGKSKIPLIIIGGAAVLAGIMYMRKKSTGTTATAATQATPEVIYPSDIANSSGQDQFDSLMTGITSGTGITANNIAAAQQQIESNIGSSQTAIQGTVNSGVQSVQNDVNTATAAPVSSQSFLSSIAAMPPAQQSSVESFLQQNVANENAGYNYYGSGGLIQGPRGAPTPSPVSGAAGTIQ